MNEKKNWFDFCYTSYCTISCNFFTFPVISSSRFSFTRLMMLYFKSSFRLLWCKFVSSLLFLTLCYDWSSLVVGAAALILVTKTHIRNSTAKNKLTLLHSMETKLHRKCDCNYFSWWWWTEVWFTVTNVLHIVYTIRMILTTLTLCFLPSKVAQPNSIHVRWGFTLISVGISLRLMIN